MIDYIMYLFLEFQKVVEKGVESSNDLPAILFAVVVAYLTILISVAIAIFNENKEFEVLDRNVILDHIIEAKWLLIYLGMTFVPLLFWNCSLMWTRVFEIVSWAIGIVLLMKILFNAYHWMKGNKYQLRFEYLQQLRDKKDIEEAWRSVWQTDNINFQNEKEYYNIFESTLSRLFENEE